ncbi:hypothetical protein AAVH_20173 [Aphelenchoides avenae]|nr:hypothetical protein AAVH_20173 [Aphelenchus avenae]
MKRRPAIIEMQQLMFRFEYDAQLVYESGKQIPPQQQVGTSASFANSPVDAWGMNGIAWGRLL